MAKYKFEYFVDVFLVDHQNYQNYRLRHWTDHTGRNAPWPYSMYVCMTSFALKRRTEWNALNEGTEWKGLPTPRLPNADDDAA